MRISPERLAKAFEQEKTISAEDYEKVKGLAAIVRPLRSFIFKTPDEYGMEYQELVIPSDDGVPLEAWYIPAKEKIRQTDYLQPRAAHVSCGLPRSFRYAVGGI